MKKLNLLNFMAKFGSLFLVVSSNLYAEEDKILKGTCSFSVSQAWPSKSDCLFDPLDFFTYQMQNEEIELNESSLTFEEGNANWSLVDGHSIAESPNINNFRLKIYKLEKESGDTFLGVDLLFVKRNFVNNVRLKSLYKIPADGKVDIYLEQAFGPDRSRELNRRMTSEHDYEEDSIFSKKNPALLLNGSCDFSEQS